jgi:hypothetical protein
LNSVSRALALIVLAVTLTGCATWGKCSTPEFIIGIIPAVTLATTTGCLIHEAVTQETEPIPVAHCAGAMLRDEQTGRTYCASAEAAEAAK